jgi:E3 ubiquitin-protein ligase NEDD4
VSVLKCVLTLLAAVIHNFTLNTAVVTGPTREGWECVVNDLIGTTTAATAPAAAAAATVDGSQQIAPLFEPVTDGTSYVPCDVGELLSATDTAATPAAVAAAAAQQRILDTYTSTGLLLGHALRHSFALGIDLCAVFWKVLLQLPIELADVESVDAEYHSSLQNILKTQGVDWGLVFTAPAFSTPPAVAAAAAGAAVVDLTAVLPPATQPEEVPLVPGGAAIDVDDNNKEQYVQLLVERRTEQRWGAQASALAAGLSAVLPRHFLSSFTAEDWALVLGGGQPLEADALLSECSYTNEGGGLTAARKQQLQGWFEALVRSLTPLERRQLLRFATGSSVLSSSSSTGSGSGMQVSLLAEYEHRQRLPRAATCFKTLKLPAYPDFETLRASVLIAVRFGSAGYTFL